MEKKIPCIDKQKKCPDCVECQMCGKSRCQLCKKGGHPPGTPELGPYMTHGEYLEWKRRKNK